MTVLFVAFEFPPLTCGGVHRPLAFLKYLPEFGIEPVVLTTDGESYRRTIVNPSLDYSLVNRIPANIHLHRAPCASPMPAPKTRLGEWCRIFFSLAEEAPKLWAPQVMACVEKIAREHRAEAIYATSPPFHVANIACQIARKLSLPLVLDLRDAWSQWRIGPYGSYLHYLLTLWMERRCLVSASRVVTTSSQTRADLLRLHPQVPAEKIVVITNGYDRDISDWSLSRPMSNDSDARAALFRSAGTFSVNLDSTDGPLSLSLSPSEGERVPSGQVRGFGGSKPERSTREVLSPTGEGQGEEDLALGSNPTSSRPFVIGYVGTFYYSPGARAAMMLPWWRKPPHRMIQYSPRKEDWLYRSPWFFFQAVARLLADHPEQQSLLRIRFAGRKPDWIDSQVERFGLAGNVEFLGPLDHTSALKFQEECDALLVTSSKVIGGSDYSIAGKTFEYFSMRKPIIGFVAEGAQKDILTESGLAVICDPDNPADSARQLDELLSGRIRLQPNTAFLKTLHRRELTRKLAEVMREAVG